MNIEPLKIGKIHLIGIGGIGISGIAEILHSFGYAVQGSDVQENANIERLREKGIPIFIGHKAENIKGARYIVHSTAIKAGNPEILEAKKLGLPIIHRAEMLAEILRFRPCVAVSGTHGKTTTTSLVANLFDHAHLNPTVINGGIINRQGTNAWVGEGRWIVVEADESDATFIKIPATIAVVTNIDPEHLDFYKSFDTLKKAFQKFVDSIPFYGFSVLCSDHPEVKALLPHIKDRRFITYGFEDSADIRAHNLRFDEMGVIFDVTIQETSKTLIKLNDLFLPMHGEHNVLNSLVTIAIGRELGIELDIIREALSNFSGVKRRFTHVGKPNGVTIIDDYAHHPTEIAAVLRAGHQATQGKLIAIIQPHRFSRLHNLMEEFSTCAHNADEVILLPVHTAGEDPIEGVTHQALAEKMIQKGQKNVYTAAGEQDLPKILKRITKSGDMVVCMGAGTITQIAYNLPSALEESE